MHVQGSIYAYIPKQRRKCTDGKQHRKSPECLLSLLLSVFQGGSASLFPAALFSQQTASAEEDVLRWRLSRKACRLCDD